LLLHDQVSSRAGDGANDGEENENSFHGGGDNPSGLQGRKAKTMGTRTLNTEPQGCRRVAVPGNVFANARFKRTFVPQLLCWLRAPGQAILLPMKHNSYFDGKVQSLAVNTPEGPATVGVIEPGKYTFKTDSEERMYVVAGTLKAKLPGRAWQTFAQGQTFVVPAHAAFDIEAASDVAYLCHYKR